MKGKQPANPGASIRARLEIVARKRGVEFQAVLSEFAIERILFRIGASAHADRFILKGATLFRLWSAEQGRATWDLDLLGRGDHAVETVIHAIQELCLIPSYDGLELDPQSVTGESIRAPDDYGGVRVRLVARLAAARIPVQIDVGFGDAVVPGPLRVDFPTLLPDSLPPRVLAYPPPVVVAEKIEAVISLGVTNSRMKDFYDLHRLAASMEFSGATLVRSIRATFERRGTSIPEETPVALTDDFMTATDRQSQWRAFLKRGRLTATEDAFVMAAALRRFLLPVLTAAARHDAFEAHWAPGGPWEQADEEAR